MVQDADFTIYHDMKKKLSSIREISNSFDSNSYSGQEDLFSMIQLQSKLNTCVDKIDTSTFDKLLTKKQVFIKDNYEMQQYYQSVIADECLVKQLYELTSNNSLKLNGLSDYHLFLQADIDNLIKTTDYIQKEFKSNSGYYFPFVVINFVCYRAIFDKQMILNEIMGYGINFSYFEDFMPFMQILIYGLIISNISFLVGNSKIKSKNPKIEVL